MVSWVLLVFGCWGALLTLNAARPNQRFGVFAIPSFFASWLTTELALHNFVLQVGLTLTLCWLGALEAVPGWVGLGLYIASWTVMFRLVTISRGTRAVFEAAFDNTFGDANWFPEKLRARRPRLPLLAPLWLRDRAVERISNIAYSSMGHPRHRLDIYRRRAGTQRAPVILQIHGGGWVVGDKRQQGLPLMLHLANLGYVCVAVNYRLSPGATFPEHLVDIKQAIAWCRHHIGDYGGDPSCIVLTGGSAGGHLATLAALTANDEAYQPGFESVDTTVHACIPFYGVYDFTNRLGTYPAFGLGWLLEQFVMKQPYLENPAVF
ncbi:MAG: alpha/beta hydrolase fold domain-containing protein, partial [Nannocystaceae bacterium]